ncbi:Suppressor of cytokine signaling 2 [Orchesella cincta]|uniref:Suppressor of cytokine signaling 2 n=1 Tax=Orchesella cincta TaxID=48709 RepID=A0A1D2N494_ORCCI|nr:Suppressor of cytokine signaling 2 [Orchesella cincta]
MIASMEILESALPGAFIIRDSADPRFLYSLSVQTERGPTSVRLTYRNGKFSLDADEKLAELLPKFDSVIRLIEHYVSGGTKVGKQVWVDPKGNMHSTVKLTKPVRKDVGSLKHLTRVAINRHNLQPPNSSASTTTCTTKTTSPTSSSSPATSSSVSEYKNVSAAPNCDDNGTPGVIPTVADLRLPLSLQAFMQEYPYNL